MVDVQLMSLDGQVLNVIRCLYSLTPLTVSLSMAVPRRLSTRMQSFPLLYAGGEG